MNGFFCLFRGHDWTYSGRFHSTCQRCGKEVGISDSTARYITAVTNSEQNKMHLLFAFNDHEAIGGEGDYQGRFKTLAAASIAGEGHPFEEVQVFSVLDDKWHTAKSRYNKD